MSHIIYELILSRPFAHDNKWLKSLNHQIIYVAPGIKNQFMEWLACNFSASEDSSLALAANLFLPSFTFSRKCFSGRPVI